MKHYSDWAALDDLVAPNTPNTKVVTWVNAKVKSPIQSRKLAMTGYRSMDAILGPSDPPFLNKLRWRPWCRWEPYLVWMVGSWGFPFHWLFQNHQYINGYKRCANPYILINQLGCLKLFIFTRVLSMVAFSWTYLIVIVGLIACVISLSAWFYSEGNPAW